MEEARKWLEATDLHSLGGGSKSKTVADATQAWVDRAQADELERSTIENYERAQRFIDFYLGSILLSELTKDQVITFRKELATAKSAATAQRTLHILKMMLNQAVDDAWMTRNVARRLRSAKSARHREAETKKINVPPRADLRAMVAVLEKRVETLREKRKLAAVEKDPETARKLRDERNMAERSRAMFETLFETGVRPSELRGLAWPQIKWDRCAIEVRQRVDKWNVMGVCKTRAAYRHIPLPEHVLRVLREWKEDCPTSGHDLVFPTAGGMPISLPNLQREFARLQRDAGLSRVVTGPTGKRRHVKKYNLKDCRHGAASWWIHKRINLKELTTRMGHSSIQVTFDVYGHIIEEVEATGATPSEGDDDLYT